jgi:histidinol-phosphate aminotransferase
LVALDNEKTKNEWVDQILSGRDWLSEELKKLSIVLEVFPSDANFLLVRFNDPTDVYKYLTSKKIIVRNRSGLHGCEGCLRITVGTQEENQILIESLNEYEK